MLVEGGACATAQWHNGQSKPGSTVRTDRPEHGRRQRRVWIRVRARAVLKLQNFPVETRPHHLRKSQLNSSNFVTNMTFRMVFDTRSQEAVEICLEMFSAEQNVALHKSRFFEKKFSNSSNTLSQTFAAEATKELRTI